MTYSKQTDVVIVGSGPGGATVARQLARANAGLGVTLLERGRDWRGSSLYGTYPGAMLYSDRRSLLFTDEGLNIIRPLMVGGATSMYCGCAARPLPFWQARYGINLDPYADETGDELHIAPLPAELRGAASTRIATAAGDAGTAVDPLRQILPRPVVNTVADPYPVQGGVVFVEEGEGNGRLAGIVARRRCWRGRGGAGGQPAAKQENEQGNIWGHFHRRYLPRYEFAKIGPIWQIGPISRRSIVARPDRFGKTCQV